MKKKITSLLIVFMMIATVIPSTCSTAYAAAGDAYNFNVSGVYNYDSGHEMLEYINEERAAKGLNSLVLDKDLTDAAMQRAAEIAFYFSHTRPNGAKWYRLCDKAFAENISGGLSTPEATFIQWKNSSGHYDNMMGAAYKSIGIGHFTQGGVHFWVQLFGVSGIVKETRTGSQNVKTKVSVVEQNETFGFNLNSLSQGDGFELATGEQYTLKAGMWNAGWYSVYGDIDADSFVWKSSNESVAKVSQTGVVTAIAPGNATITAMVNNGSETESAVSVKVGNDIRKAVVSGIKAKTYTGKEIKQNLTVTYNNKNLTENVDYRLEYSYNVNAGTAYLDIIGIGDFSGTLNRTFTINPKDIADSVDVKLNGWDYSSFSDEYECLEKMLDVTYNGKTLVYNRDYGVYAIAANGVDKKIDSFCIYFRGNYTGFKDMVCLETAYIKPIGNKTYTGKQIKPKPALYWGEWAIYSTDYMYKEGVDYKVTYKNNINVGTATVNIIAIGNCYGSTKTTFKITQPKYKVTFKGNGGTASKKSKTVTYNTKYGEMPTAQRAGYSFTGWYTDAKGGNKVTASTVYKNKSNKTLYAHWNKVNVGKPGIKSLINQKGSKLKVTVGTVTGAKGYQIVIAKNAKFTKGKKTAVVTSANYKTFTKLSKTKYYVKIRAFKYDSAGKKVYGKYSKVKTVRIKK